MPRPRTTTPCARLFVEVEQGAEEAARRNKALWRLSPDRALPLLLVACLALFVALALWAR